MFIILLILIPLIAQEKPTNIQPIATRFSAQDVIQGSNCCPMLYISMYDTEDPLQLGCQTIYVIEITNYCTTPITEILLKIHRTQHIKFESVEGQTNGQIKEDQIVFDPVASLAPEEKIIYKIEATAVQEGQATVTAFLGCAEFSRLIICEEHTMCYDAD